jgi:hypothetical protein
LFEDAKGLGVSVRKQTFLDNKAETGDVLYQLGLRVGGLAASIGVGSLEIAGTRP